VQRRFDTPDRHAADLMFLQLSSQEIVWGQGQDLSEHNRALIIRAVAGEPFASRCPCCSSTPVLTGKGRPVAGAEFDHFFHHGPNRPEHGWLICQACHRELTHGGYIAQFERMPEFRRIQAVILARKPGRNDARCRNPVAKPTQVSSSRRPSQPHDLIRGHGAFRVSCTDARLIHRRLIIPG